MFYLVTCGLKFVLFSIYVNDIGNIGMIENTILFVVDDTSLICKDLNLAKLDLQLNLTEKTLFNFIMKVVWPHKL